MPTQRLNDRLHMIIIVIRYTEVEIGRLEADIVTYTEDIDHKTQL